LPADSIAEPAAGELLVEFLLALGGSVLRMFGDPPIRQEFGERVELIC